MAKASGSAASKEIVAELEDARQRLAANIDAISNRVSPGNIARRQKKRAIRLFKGDDGSINVRNIAIVAGVVGLLVVYGVRKRGI